MYNSILVLSSGRRLSEQELAVLTIRLLQKYRIEWASSETLGQHYKVILQPDVHLRFRLIPRVG